MIDEEKILREIEEIKEQYEENSPEKKLLDGFAEYIRMQEKVDIKKVYPLIELTMKKITNQVIVDGQMKLHNKITGQTILCMNMKEKRILLQNGLGLK